MGARLIKCADCGAEVSPRAKTCPKCGAPVRRRGRRTAIVVFGVLLLFWAATQIAERGRGSSVGSGGGGGVAAVSSSSEPPVEISGDPSLLPRETVLRAIGIFRSNCTPLGGGRMWSELTKVSVSVQREAADYRRALGWRTTLALNLVVPPNPRAIPDYDARTGVVGGHTLWYFLGGGDRPGFFASKRVSQMLCGAPINQDGRDEFVSVPALSILD